MSGDLSSLLFPNSLLQVQHITCRGTEIGGWYDMVQEERNLSVIYWFTRFKITDNDWLSLGGLTQLFFHISYHRRDILKYLNLSYSPTIYHSSIKIILPKLHSGGFLIPTSSF